MNYCGVSTQLTHQPKCSYGWRLITENTFKFHKSFYSGRPEQGLPFFFGATEEAVRLEKLCALGKVRGGLAQGFPLSCPPGCGEQILKHLSVGDVFWPLCGFLRSAEGRAEGSLGGSSASVDLGSAMSVLCWTAHTGLMSRGKYRSTAHLEFLRGPSQLCSIQECLGGSELPGPGFQSTLLLCCLL